MILSLKEVKITKSSIESLKQPFHGESKWADFFEKISFTLIGKFVYTSSSFLGNLQFEVSTWFYIAESIVLTLTTLQAIQHISRCEETSFKRDVSIRKILINEIGQLQVLSKKRFLDL